MRQYRQKIKTYFDSLDEDGSQAIGTDEMEEPLLSLGIAKSKVQVNALMSTNDKNDSTQINFEEFLNILKGSNKIHGDSRPENLPNEGIMKFFKGTPQ